MPARAAGLPPPGELVKPELVAEAGSVAPGTTLWVDAHFDIKPGWHIYWRNPGDTGLPTTIAWTLPPGFSAGDIAWPVPERFVVGAFANYGYGGSADLLVPIAVPVTIDPGASPRLDAEIKWLVCAEICIPGEARLGLSLPIGTITRADPTVATRFAAARRRLPIPAPFTASFAAEAHDLRLMIPDAVFAGLDQPTMRFFPFDGDAIDQLADPKLEPRRGTVDLVLEKVGDASVKVPATLDGVLVLRGADGAERAFEISAGPVVVVPWESGPRVPWWEALIFAFVGGIILNLMPCVFPILSLKLMSLAGAVHRAEETRHGLAYGVGVLLSFALIGGALIGLRAGGVAIGWGFQLQSPVVVGLLAYLMFAMGLSLSGVAEFGARLTGIGSRLAGHSGLVGAFFTGVLATIVATPCTAPFMGAALGAALVAPAPLGMAIFIALGMGLAAPLVLASFLPGLGRVMPRPGAWMELFKQILAFPLYGTVAWLIWVLIQEVGPESALAALFGLVLVGFAVWIWGRTRLAGSGMRQIGGALAAAGLAAAIILAAMLTPAGVRSTQAASRDGLPYEPFAAARLAALTAEHKPIFVNLTAAWCITCILNERATLDRAAVRHEFATHGIVALKGDWTRQDPEIAAFLQRFGRSGVPLYLLYDRDGTPEILPQILTEAGVIAAIGKL